MVATLVAGQATITVDGNNYSTDGEWDILIQDEQREAFPDALGNINYKIENKLSMISGNLFLTSDLNPSEVTSGTNVTVIVTLITGRTAVLSQAIYTGEGNVTTVDGKMAVQWEGIGRWLS